MFEHSSLHETYTGALIGGKGRALNNIRTIMTQSKFQTSDWVRVRFGAGTPWRRCWCVISPPDEKEAAKAQKTMKKRSTYDRTTIVLKGDVKFYESKKITKKTHPIATITNAYAAYAIYPQSKALIEQSTLIKIEGSITVHPQTQTQLESFIFVMPETHEAVSGFEMLLRFLFPIWDVFALYGRPQRLIPDTWNPKSLMFAMPKNDRWGYLDILDVTTLATLPGSANWSEAEWRRELKKLTADRIEKISRDPVRSNGRPSSQYGRPHRNSLPSRGAALRFADGEASESRTSFEQNLNINKNKPRSNTGAASPGPGILLGSPTRTPGHGRSVSASVPGSPVHIAANAHEEYHPTRLSHEIVRPSYEPIEEDRPLPPPPPAHVHLPTPSHTSSEQHSYHDSSEDEQRFHDAYDGRAPPYPEEAERDTMVSEPPAPVEPVVPPPAFSRQPGAKPQTRPIQSPELRRANSRMSSATLSQLAAAAGKQIMPNNGQASGDHKLEKVDDAYNRPFPSPEQTSNHSSPSVNSAASFSEANLSTGLQHQTNLQAPIQVSGRSPSPLRNMAAMTPEVQPPNKSSYFPDGASAVQLTPNPGTPHHGHALMPDDSDRIGRSWENGNSRDTSTSPRRSRFDGLGMSEDNEPKTSRNSSTGKIVRKPVPVSPSRFLTEFTAPAETSPTEIMKNKDVHDALISRVNTVKSKISTSSRRYSEDESNYDSSPEYETHPLPAWPEDVPLARDDVQPRKSDVSRDDLHHSIEHTTQARTPDPGPSAQIPHLGADHIPPYRSALHIDLRPTKGEIKSDPITKANNSSHLEPSLPISDNGLSHPGSMQIPRNFPQRTNPMTATASPPVPPEQFAQDPAAATRVPVYAYTNTRPTTAPSTGSSNHRTHYGLHPGASESLGDWSNRSLSDATTLDQQAIAPPGYTQYFNPQGPEHFTTPNHSPHPSIERKPVSPGTPSRRHNGTAETQIPAMTPPRGGTGNYVAQPPMVQQQQQQYETHPYYRYENPGQYPQYSIPGQFPITPQQAPTAWEQPQQQQNPYMHTQYQDYNEPMYGHQAPQDYYHQPQQAYNENYNQYNQHPNKHNRPYRG